MDVITLVLAPDAKGNAAVPRGIEGPFILVQTQTHLDESPVVFE